MQNTGFCLRELEGDKAKLETSNLFQTNAAGSKVPHKRGENQKIRKRATTKQKKTRERSQDRSGSQKRGAHKGDQNGETRRKHGGKKKQRRKGRAQFGVKTASEAMDDDNNVVIVWPTGPVFHRTPENKRGENEEEGERKKGGESQSAPWHRSSNHTKPRTQRHAC